MNESEPGISEKTDITENLPDNQETHQTVIPVIGKEDEISESSVESDENVDDKGSGSKTEQSAPNESEENTSPDNTEGSASIQESDDNAENSLSGSFDSKVGISLNYVYELYQDETGKDTLDLRISTPQVYYSDGVPLQNVNAYYSQYLEEYRTQIETQTLQLVMEYNKIHQESSLSTIEMGFSVVYNENWLLSVMEKENVRILGTQSERCSGQTFDTRTDIRLSIWDVLSQTDAQDTILLPAVYQVLDTLQIKYDEVYLTSALDVYAFTLDSTGITLYIDCRMLDTNAEQTAQVFLSLSSVSSCLQPDFEILLQTGNANEADLST